ncbi:MAG: GNAT family N-acetyltransferase, partial [Acidimicrobiia bacterium]|nr:GNAT family N-acetyltransferase [Acidimicrobiia bacterium]
LAARALIDPPTRDELDRAFFDAGQPAEIRGDPAVGVIATAMRDHAGFVRFLAVDPAARRNGIGTELLVGAESSLRDQGATSITVGADAPFYLWPGIDARELAAICLVERRRYTRSNVNLNMDVDLRALPPDPGGHRIATTSDLPAIDAWSARHWPGWTAEMRRGASQGGLLMSEDGDGIAAVCAYDVNRAGLVGPVAVRPDLLGRGVGVAPLLGALHRMRADDRTHAEIAWVGPIVPYARVGATLGRSFLVYRKDMS